MEKLTITEFAKYKRTSRETVYKHLSKFKVVEEYGRKKIVLNKFAKDWMPDRKRIAKKFK